MANKKSKSTIQSETQSTAKSVSAATSVNDYTFLFNHTVWMIVLPIIAVLLYCNTFQHQYVLDDFSAIKDNYVVKKGLDGISTIWQTEYRYGFWNVKGELYRPIPLTMFAIEWHIIPDSPGFSHIINVLLYAFSIVVLFIVLRKILGEKYPYIPVVATLLFTLHPLHTEVVANIKSRDEILSLLGSLATLYFFVLYHTKQKWSYLLVAFFCYLIAMFSKESSITFFAVFPLTIWLFYHKNWRSIAVSSAVLGIPIIIYLLIRSKVLGGVQINNEPTVMENAVLYATTFSERWGTIWMLIGKYFLILVKPFPLSSDWGYNATKIHEIASLPSLLGILFFVALVISCVYFFYIKPNSIVAFCAIGFLATFILYSNLPFYMSWTFGERFLYVPSLFFCILLSYILFHFLPNKNIQNSIIILICIAFSFLTFKRNFAWRSSKTLYEADIKTCPDAVMLNYHYSIEVVKNGLATEDHARIAEANDSAITLLKHAVSLYPYYHDAYGQLGLAYFRKNEYKESLAYYEKSIEYNKNNALVWSNMGTCHYNLGNFDKAKSCYMQAVKLNPRMIDAHRNLGAMFAMKRQFNEALQQFDEALQYDANCAICYFYKGKVHEDMGKPIEAKPFLEKAYQLDPKLKK